jgi:hypothetical protein
MRAIHLSDLHFAARTLAILPAASRPAAFEAALQRADIADRYRKRIRRAHPTYGLGTLISALDGGRQLDDAGECNTLYLQSMLVVVTGLLKRARQKTT